MKKIVYIAAFLMLPSLAFAQVTSITGMLGWVQGILSALMPVLVALAIIYFVWGVLKYLMNAGDEEAQKEGRSMMIYGIIAIFVMVSIWGLVGLLDTSLNLDDAAQSVPSFAT